MIPELRILHLEMTERCNAACPMCGRTASDGAGKPYLTNELSAADIESWLPAETMASLHYAFMCGNHGDPMLGRDTLAVLRLFRRRSNVLLLGMHTNGGARPREWWSELADIMGKRGKVVFSVDGLEDTNHIYRRNVRWDVLQRNFRAYIKAGGRAEWHFLVFRHNEHQIEAARALAEREGFARFILKKSARFAADSGRFEPLGEDGKPILAPPKDPRWLNSEPERLNALQDAYGGYEGWLDRTPIRCKIQEERSLYISARGHLWPCCWLGYGSVPGERQAVDEFLERNGGLDQLSLRERSLEQILRGPVFQAIQRGWSANLAGGRIAVCAKMCSTELNLHGSQYN
jgi:hypothetical protein